MEPAGQDDAQAAAATPARHYSSGRLTAAQSRTVNAWRHELHRPRRSVYGTEDGRPPASSSDCVAAAVTDLLATAAPEAMDVARYAAAIRLHHRDTRPLQFPAERAVSFYLPATVADAAEALLARAHTTHRASVDQLRGEATSRFPGRRQADERTTFLLTELAALQLTANVPKALPMGTLARMAIDHWNTRPAESVVLAAVDHSAAHHLQQHRARNDMGRQ
ncbi:hypothetical protein ACWELJ_25825 [Nocardia sp. NPDC004582]